MFTAPSFSRRILADWRGQEGGGQRIVKAEPLFLKRELLWLNEAWHAMLALSRGFVSCYENNVLAGLNVVVSCRVEWRVGGRVRWGKGGGVGR